MSVLLFALWALLSASGPARGAPSGAAGLGFAPGFDTISAADLERDARALASLDLEGRDTPSLGLEQAARWIEERFRKSGLGFAADSGAAWKKVSGADLPAPAQSGSAAGTYRRPFERRLHEPERSGCWLELESGSAGIRTFELSRDYVPVRGCEGEAHGEIVFAGYGIQSKTEKYDDFSGLKLKGRIALILEGEPPTRDGRFDGPEISREASLWEKVDALSTAGAIGVLASRRPAPSVPPPSSSSGSTSSGSTPAAPAGADRELSFRSTWAEFNGVASDSPPRHPLPVLEVSIACASEILGQDVEALAQKIDKTVHPVRAVAAAKSSALPRVRMQGKTSEVQVPIDNLVGLLHGEDATLTEEYVVLGAHYDHVGIDARGRIAPGADDNASGVAGMLEIAEALAAAGPRRSVLVCAFAGEEDGLLGSRAFCERPPVPKERIVAMVNLDMIGRGEGSEVAVLGILQNPVFDKVLDRAKKLRPSGVRQIVMRQGEDLFQRSDHYSFHRIGVPALFFFEGLPIDRNKGIGTPSG